MLGRKSLPVHPNLRSELGRSYSAETGQFIALDLVEWEAVRLGILESPAVLLLSDFKGQ